MRRRALVIALVWIGCSSDGADAQDTGSTHADDTAATTVDGDATTVTATSASTSASDGATETTAETGTDDTGEPGGPGCGFASAAFCDTFDAPSAVRGRAGDLDPSRWSAARGNPQLPSGNGNALAAGPATIGTCRADLPAQVFPDEDTLVCDSNESIASNHLLVAVGAQNYGQNSYRIRQPFDFEARTGTIAFDAEGFVINPLLGWISIELTEDPTPIPSFSIGAPDQNNDEGGAIPRNAVEVQFQAGCAGEPGSVGVRFIDVITDYQDTLFTPETPTCVAGAQGKLNHFEIAVSQSRVEVWATPFSDDGTSFAAPILLHAADVALPFARGWVHITTHNHATIKYSHDDTQGAPAPIDAWVARWDNVGFDGPVIATTRESEVPDSLVASTDAWNIPGPVMNVGYRVPDAMDGAPLSFVLEGVDPTGMGSARLAIAMWYLLNDPAFPTSGFVLRYRLNGGTWHERTPTASEIAVLESGHAQGAIGQMLDVPIEDLVVGDNTLEIETSGVPQSYPPVASAIDLILAD